MAEYRAATEGCGVVVRGDRRMLRVHGRAPRQMLNGILTSRIPEAAGAVGMAVDGGESAASQGGPLVGHSVYGTILTAKGRMVTDVETVWLGADEAAGLGLSVADAGLQGAFQHFKRFLPPRFARLEDLGDRVAMLTVVGAGANDVAGTVWADGAAQVGAAGFVLLDGGPLGGGVLLARGLRQAPSWNVWVASEQLPHVMGLLQGAGASRVGSGTWHTLRVEAGFPQFGVDMDDGTIPIEAGLGDCAFDHDKGCYTGQEVIVRIRHRGRVNWHLRGLRFGEAAARPGAQLFGADGGKVRGRVTSVADSPRFGETIGLGYVRREVEPPATLRLGDGAEVRVVGLDE